MLFHAADNSDDPLLVLESATIVRLGGDVVFRDLNWTIREGETWAVVGPIGSGKSTLAEVLLGRHRLEAGTRTWPFLQRLRLAGRTIAWPSEVIQRVSFKEESALFSYGRHYYQQRFNFIEPQDDLTLETFLHAGVERSEAEIHQAATRLGIGELLPLSFIKLSNGQTRRARIARALLSQPELLILDEPFLGLDIEGRHEVAQILADLIRHGTRLLLITRADAIPDWVTHVLELEPGALRWHGPRADYRPALQPHSTPSLREPIESKCEGQPIIELRHVNVAYGDRTILRDISLTVQAGERWAILGPNGSGKSTLLSLLCGDHPQAYSNDIRLFGRQRGTGESIWDIKRQVGLVSPELHLYFSEPLTAAETAATGFFDVLAFRHTTPQQRATVQVLFDEFGIAKLADRPFARLSTGEQRLVLLIRALVKYPPLLILDEPFQGLDDRVIAYARDWLDDRLRPNQTLLFVSHYQDEIPRSVERKLCLQDGRVVQMV